MILNKLRNRAMLLQCCYSYILIQHLVKFLLPFVFIECFQLLLRNTPISIIIRSALNGYPRAPLIVM